MQELLTSYYALFPLPLLFMVIAITIYALVRGADLLVEEAVTLSVRSGLSKMLIGATIVSLGTTLPEAAVSVFAAVAGQPGLALGNAVGSVICDTGLIMGLVIIIAPPHFNKHAVRRQGLIQLGCGLLLVLACLPYTNLRAVFVSGGRLSQIAGIVFVFLLVGYFWFSAKWAKKDTGNREKPQLPIDKTNNVLMFIKLLSGIFIVVLSSKILIPAVQETAIRLKVPESIIAATLVAFGTSLPELVTALTAVRKRHSELAIGNIIGADILNVLFVSGVAAAVTPGGLYASANFFRLLFPAFLLILAIFMLGIVTGGNKFKRSFGFVLLVIYIVITFISYK